MPSVPILLEGLWMFKMNKITSDYLQKLHHTSWTTVQYVFNVWCYSMHIFIYLFLLRTNYCYWCHYSSLLFQKRFAAWVLIWALGLHSVFKPNYLLPWESCMYPRILDINKEFPELPFWPWTTLSLTFSNHFVLDRVAVDLKPIPRTGGMKVEYTLDVMPDHCRILCTHIHTLIHT